MNWLLVTVMIIFLISIVVGAVRGAIKILVSLVTTLVTFLIVFFAAPYVSDAIAKFTPLDEAIETQVSNAIANAAVSQLAGGSEGGMTADNVRRALGAAGLNEDTLAQYGITVEDIVNGNISKSELSKYGISGSVLDGLLGGQQAAAEAIEGTEIPREMQMEAIQNADLPDVFKNLLTVNNNSEIYKQLGVETFAQYVGGFMAKLFIDIVSFLCTFLLVTIILRAIVFALDIVADLPGIGAVNHLAGALLGVAGALVVVWLMFLIITLMFTTSIGKEMFRMIEASGFLQVLYDYNPVLKLATLFR
ncbi:MAG: CvpA family protein [Dorea sp.]|nr:CvpA family protein [Dorea sp.]